MMTIKAIFNLVGHAVIIFAFGFCRNAFNYYLIFILLIS